MDLQQLLEELIQGQMNTDVYITCNDEDFDVEVQHNYTTNTIRLIVDERNVEVVDSTEFQTLKDENEQLTDDAQTLKDEIDNLERRLSEYE